MHKLLQRQLKKHLGLDPGGPLPEGLTAFIEAVDKAYEQSDADRRLLERSLDLSSRELLQSNSAIRAMLDVFPDLLFRMEKDGKIIESRAGHKTKALLPVSELVGRRIQDIPIKAVSDQFRDAIAHVLRGDEMVSIDYALESASGARRFEARFMRLPGEQIFATVRDVTERSELEDRVRQSEKLSAVGRLAAGVAHELNNPLGVILGFSEGLTRRVKEGDPSYAPLKSIEREAVRCKELVQALLQFSRRSGAKIESFKIDDAVSGALALIAAQSRLKSIELDRRLDFHGMMQGDRVQLQQALINLCMNAIDAMPGGGRLTVTSERGERDGAEWIVLKVEDTGGGIPDAIKARIFEPFFTTKEPGKGTGLGLALVYECVRKHGGTISVDSRRGKGTLFTIELPASGASSMPLEHVQCE